MSRYAIGNLQHATTTAAQPQSTTHRHQPLPHPRRERVVATHKTCIHVTYHVRILLALWWFRHCHLIKPATQQARTNDKEKMRHIWYLSGTPLTHKMQWVVECSFAAVAVCGSGELFVVSTQAERIDRSATD